MRNARSLLGIWCLIALGTFLAARDEGDSSPQDPRATQLAQNVSAYFSGPAIASYRAEYEHAFLLSKEIWKATGAVRIRRRAADGSPQIAIEIRAQLTEPDGTQRSVSLWRQGADWTWIDHTSREYSRAGHAGLAGVASLVVRELALEPWQQLEPLSGEGTPEAKPPLSWKSKLCRVLETEHEDGTQTRWIVDAVRFEPQIVERSQGHCCGKETATKWTLIKAADPAQAPSAPQPAALAALQWRQPADPVIESPPELAPAAALNRFPDESLAPFVERFNRAADRPRIVGVFSPT